MRKPGLILVLGIVTACNDAPTKKPLVDSPSPPSAVPTSNTTAPESKPDNDSTIYIHFKKDSISATAEGLLKGRESHVTVYIDVANGKLLNAVLQPEDKKSNLRINQVITPTGAADGPFGNELNYKLKERGTYKLIIAQNLMAEGPLKERFRLRVTVQ